jgi:hypothetical protein
MTDNCGQVILYLACGFLVLLALALSVGIFKEIQYSKAFRHRCEEDRGVYIAPYRSQQLCLLLQTKLL